MRFNGGTIAKNVHLSTLGPLFGERPRETTRETALNSIVYVHTLSISRNGTGLHRSLPLLEDRAS